MDASDATASRDIHRGARGGGDGLQQRSGLTRSCGGGLSLRCVADLSEVLSMSRHYRNNGVCRRPKTFGKAQIPSAKAYADGGPRHTPLGNLFIGKQAQTLGKHSAVGKDNNAEGT